MSPSCNQVVAKGQRTSESSDLAASPSSCCFQQTQPFGWTVLLWSLSQGHHPHPCWTGSAPPVPVLLLALLGEASLDLPLPHALGHQESHGFGNWSRGGSLQSRPIFIQTQCHYKKPLILNHHSKICINEHIISLFCCLKCPYLLPCFHITRCCQVNHTLSQRCDIIGPWTRCYRAEQYALHKYHLVNMLQYWEGFVAHYRLQIDCLFPADQMCAVSVSSLYRKFKM